MYEVREKVMFSVVHDYFHRVEGGRGPVRSKIEGEQERRSLGQVQVRREGEKNPRGRG